MFLLPLVRNFIKPKEPSAKWKVLWVVMFCWTVGYFSNVFWTNLLPFRTQTKFGFSVEHLYQPQQCKENFHRSKANVPPAHQQLHSTARRGGPLSRPCVRHDETRDQLVPQQAADPAHEERGFSFRWDHEHCHAHLSGCILWARWTLHLQGRKHRRKSRVLGYAHRNRGRR